MTYWSRSFQGLAESLSEVRQFTVAVLGNRPGVDLVVLAASELAGNAVQHTASGLPGGQFVVHVAAYADKWQVRVDDEGGDNEPVLKEPDGDDPDEEELAEAGRGLALVAAVSRDWGVLGDHYARAVWADIPHEAPAEAEVSGGARTGGALEALEAVLDAVEADEPPTVSLQSSDSSLQKPTVPGATPGAAPPESEPDDTPPHLGQLAIRRPRRGDSWEPPNRQHLRAAGVTELEAMLIEMAYSETVGRL